MPKLLSDPQYPNLKQNPKTGIYYFRKYTTERGEITISLKEKNRSKAIRAMNRVQSQWLGSKHKKGEVLVDDVIDELLELKQVQAQSTYDTFEITRRVHIQPYFTGFTLLEMARAVPAYMAHQKKINPKRKLGHDGRYINEILNYGVKQGYIDSFPRHELSKKETDAKPGREYSNEEIELILKHLPYAKVLQVELIRVTGMRHHEVRKLKKSSINVKYGYIDLNDPNEIKTGMVRLFPAPIKILNKLLDFSKDNDSEYVFRHKNSPLKPECRSDSPWQRCEKRILKHEKIELKVNVHWIRHTVATRARRVGFSDKEIERNLGMSSAVFNKTYAHPSLWDKKRMADKIAKTFSIKERHKNGKQKRKA